MEQNSKARCRLLTGIKAHRLAFEDMGILSKAMDKKMDSLLKKVMGLHTGKFKTSDGSHGGGQKYGVLVKPDPGTH